MLSTVFEILNKSVMDHKRKSSCDIAQKSVRKGCSCSLGSKVFNLLLKVSSLMMSIEIVLYKKIVKHENETNMGTIPLLSR